MSSTAWRWLASLTALLSVPLVGVWAYGIALIGLSLLGLAWGCHKRAQRLDAQSAAPLSVIDRSLERSVLVLTVVGALVSLVSLALVK